MHTATKHLTIRLAPNVNFKDYQSINIENVTITFKENWLTNYNQDRKSLSNKLNDEDVRKIKERFSKQFTNSFSKQITENNFTNLN